MKYFFSFCLFCLATMHSYSQSTSKNYRASTTELILSYGLVNDTAGKQFDATPRFSGFFHHQEQFHFNFGKSVGIYTGIGVRNIGLVTKPAKGIRVKQRAYGLGIPLAFKFGNMEDKKFIAIGAEAEYFFNYKEKFFVDGKKHKSNEWFSDRVTPFNPSVFIEWEDANGVFIRAKYYLLNFLKPQNDLVINDSLSVAGYSESSMLFALSIGLSIRSKDKGYKNVMKNKPTAVLNKG